MLAAAGLKIAGAHVAVSAAGTLRDMTLDLLEFSKPTEVRSPAIFAAVAARRMCCWLNGGGCKDASALTGFCSYWSSTFVRSHLLRAHRRPWSKPLGVNFK